MSASDGFRSRVAATRDVWRPGTVRRLPAGRIDDPGRGRAATRQATAIRGWAMFPTGPAVRVDVWLGDTPIGRARLGVARPDVEQRVRVAGAGVSGFELVHDFGPWRFGEATVRAVATGPCGERLELDPVHTAVLDSRPVASSALAPVTQRRDVRPGGARLLVFTHELSAAGGAQLVVADLVRSLVETHAFECTVVSPRDGPLREALEASGAEVHVSGEMPLDDPRAYGGRIEELAAWAADRFDAVLANTVTSFPGVEVATRVGIPALWAIHDSYELPVLWWLMGEGLHPEVRLHAHACLGLAAAVVFPAEATLRLYEPHIRPGRGLVLPCGIDLDRVDLARRGFDAAAARRERSIPLDAQVVLCAGTVEPRKAQVPLAQAFGLIADRHPRAHLVFLGGRDDEHTRALTRYIEGTGLADRARVVPIVPEPWPWYGLADLLVCASDVESLPRSVIEAMAWETPVLATEVFGLPELIEHGESGWLCPARDVRALADALDAALATDVTERARVGAAGRKVVERRHSLIGYAAAVARLVQAEEPAAAEAGD